jgi:hypothetical protein
MAITNDFADESRAKQESGALAGPLVSAPDTGVRGGQTRISPGLEEAEGWIASQPRGAPATRRRNIVTSSLAAGLVLALALAALVYWQRGVAVEQRGIAQQAEQRHDEVRIDVRKGTHTAPSKSITVEAAAEAWIKRVEVNRMRLSARGHARMPRQGRGEPAGALSIGGPPSRTAPFPQPCNFALRF